MKSKILSIFAFAACLLIGFTSCKDNEDFTPSQEEIADYTVIFWCSAGDNDGWVVSDLADLMVKREDGKINNKVNMVGCIDPTMKYSQALADYNLGGTLEFELGTKRNTGADTLSAFKNAAGFENGFKLCDLYDNEESVVSEYLELYSKLFPSMKSCKANSDYNIYSSQSLAQFIAKAAKEHPAKNYILMFYGHGTGFIPCVGADAKAGLARSTDTRSCVTSTDGKRQMLALEDVTNAINGSSVKIKTVFYQCCQMAALENFASMQNVTEYVVASAEPTISGYIGQFVSYLSEVGATDEGMKTACKKAVDFYVTDCLDNSCNFNLSSQGFYDLSLTSQLLGCVNEAAAWMASAAKTNPLFMNDVVFGSVIVNSLGLSGNSKNAYTESHREQQIFNKALRGGQINLDKNVTVYDFVSEVVYGNLKNQFGICFASIMDKALSDDLAAEAKGLDLNKLEDINTRYQNTLKQMAYIRCNGVETDNAAYRFASPSVNLFCLNEQGYHLNMKNYVVRDGVLYKEGIKDVANIINEPLSANDPEGAYNKFVNILSGTFFAATEPSYVNTRAIYQAIDFDKTTGWSKVMENINVNPLFLVNPIRYDVTNK